MRKALIIVDMLNDFVHPDGKLFFQAGADIIPAVWERIKEHRADGNLRIYLYDAHAKDDLEFDRFPPHAIENTWGSEIVAELNPRDEDVLFVPKTRYSGFYGTELDEQLRVWGPSEVEVVGVCTSICVMDTVGGLANRNYKITVPLNAIADFDPEASAAAINRMGGLYGAKFI